VCEWVSHAHAHYIDVCHYLLMCIHILPTKRQCVYLCVLPLCECVCGRLQLNCSCSCCCCCSYTQFTCCSACSSPIIKEALPNSHTATENFNNNSSNININNNNSITTTTTTAITTTTITIGLNLPS